MRVLHVSAGNLYGGIERILVEIASVDGGAGRHEFALSFEGRAADDLRTAGATVTVLGSARFSRPWSVWRARRRLASIVNAGRYQAVVCHAPWSYGLAAPVVPGAARVFWAHDASDGRHWTERRVQAERPCLAICNSQYTANALRRWLPGARLEVIYAPVAPAPATETIRRDVRREMGTVDATTVFVIASRFERWKGHLDLLRAAARLHGDWSVWIAGGPQRASEDAYARDIRDEIAHLAIDARVRLLGDRPDVRRVLRGADVHVQPNATPEPFGLAFVEALDAGLPVITTAGGGALEIVTAECGILVAPGDLDALTSALQRMIDDSALRLRLGAAGPARAAALCDPAAQLRRLDEALSAACGAAT